MFGSDRFAFETPNVIDPGDLPPSRPRRESTGRINNSNTPSTESDNDSDDYQEARESSKRLLRDIDDLDLTPQPYDPYDDDVPEKSHSLPSVEEARLYASTLLNSSELRSQKELSPLTLGRTLQLDAPSSQHLVRKRLYRDGLKVGVAICGIVLIITIGVVIAHSKGSSGNSYSERENQIIEFLSSNGVSDRISLTSDGTPQQLALDWMANGDSLQYEVPEALHSVDRFLQRYCLAVFYFATGGPTWSDRLKFITPEDECAWAREKQFDSFSMKQFPVGVSCDENLNVITLFVPENKLSGSLPSELRFLSNLEMLSLADNFVSAELPDDMHYFTSLVYFDVRGNGIEGKLPDWIGDLSELEVLGLSNNNFTGTIPPSVGTLGRLMTLALDDNQITGGLDSLRFMTSLEYFYADRNLLEGPIDSFWLSGSTRLRELDLSGNLFTGTGILQTVFAIDSLEVLDLADNQFNGTIYNQTVPLHNLKFLSLRGNNFSGPIPPSLSGFQNLTTLDLHDNALSGTIPVALGKLSNLEYLFLGMNKFDSKYISPVLSELINLQEFSMTRAQLRGQIPDWISDMTHLTFLDLSDNGLTGEIPASILQLPELAYVFLNDNQIHGTIPQYNSTSLKVLTVFHTLLHGDADRVCLSSPGLELVAVDCPNITCSRACCPSCCEANATSCFSKELDSYSKNIEGYWEFNYSRASYSFDPAILEEAGVSPQVP